MACAGGPSTTSLWAALQVVGWPACAGHDDSGAPTALPDLVIPGHSLRVISHSIARHWTQLFYEAASSMTDTSTCAVTASAAALSAASTRKA